MLSIRLRRTGAAKRPYFRVVVADSRSTRDGRFVEVLGHYDPRPDPAVVEIKSWAANGQYRCLYQWRGIGRAAAIPGD